jgi:hypothetical protein
MNLHEDTHLRFGCTTSIRQELDDIVVAPGPCCVNQRLSSTIFGRNVRSLLDQQLH